MLNTKILTNLVKKVTKIVQNQLQETTTKNDIFLQDRDHGHSDTDKDQEGH